MSKEQARQEIRRRQTEVARRFMAEGETGGVTTRTINAALKAAGLPAAQDHAEMEAIVNGFDVELTPEQLAAQAFFMGEVAAYLREGGFESLADAMEKTGLPLEQIEAQLQKPCPG